MSGAPSLMRQEVTSSEKSQYNERVIIPGRWGVPVRNCAKSNFCVGLQEEKSRTSQYPVTSWGEGKDGMVNVNEFL